MIEGEVNENLEAIIPVEIHSDSNLVEIRAIIDTGCSEHLVLPPNLVRSLKLSAPDSILVKLADGSAKMLALGRATIRWGMNDRPITFLVAEGVALAGMSLLENCSLNVEIFLGGRVTIEKFD